MGLDSWLKNDISLMMVRIGLVTVSVIQWPNAGVCKPCYVCITVPKCIFLCISGVFNHTKPKKILGRPPKDCCISF